MSSDIIHKVSDYWVLFGD